MCLLLRSVSCMQQNAASCVCIQSVRLYLFKKILLDIFFIYISNVIPFPSFPSKNTLFLPPFPCSRTHPLPLPRTVCPLYRGLEQHRTKGLFSHWWPTRSSSAAYAWVGPLCIFFDWLFSPRELRGAGSFILLFFLGECKSFQLLGNFL